MNSVYKELRGVFDGEESYTGEEILQALLASIKVSLVLYGGGNTAGSSGLHQGESRPTWGRKYCRLFWLPSR